MNPSPAVHLVNIELLAHWLLLCFVNSYGVKNSSFNMSEVSLSKEASVAEADNSSSER